MINAPTQPRSFVNVAKDAFAWLMLIVVGMAFAAIITLPFIKLFLLHFSLFVSVILGAVVAFIVLVLFAAAAHFFIIGGT